MSMMPLHLHVNKKSDYDLYDEKVLYYCDSTCMIYKNISCLHLDLNMTMQQSYNAILSRILIRENLKLVRENQGQIRDFVF